MSTQTPVDKEHPLMIAWERHKATGDYANSKKWAETVAHVHLEGSLWALFVAGWNAAGGLNGALASSPSQPWISVKERLPGEDETTLVFFAPSRGKVHGGCWSVANYSRGTWYDPEDDDDVYTTPTHWMPLPAAPALGEPKEET